MEIKIDCPIQVGDLVWIKPDDSYNFVQSKVTDVETIVKNGYVKRTYYYVEAYDDYSFSDDDEGLFLKKEDIFKFYADELRKKVPDDFGKYVFCDKSTTVYQKINNLVGELNATLDTPNISDAFTAQIKSTIEQLNKIKAGY